MKTYYLLSALIFSLVSTATATPQDHKLEQKVRAIYAAIDANNGVSLRKLLTPNYLFYNPFSPQPLDADGLIGFSAQTAQGFTNPKHGIKEIIVSGSQATVIATFTGRHTGLFNGIPATGKDVMMDLISVIEFDRRGLATVQTTQANALSLLIQLGVVPPPNPNSNIPRVIDIYQTFGRGDIPGLVGKLDKDVIWDGRLNPLFSTGRVYKGQQDVFNFFTSLSAESQITNFIPLNFFETGDKVYVHGMFEYTRLSDKKKVTVNWTMVWTFKNEKAIGFKEHFEVPIDAGL